MSETLVAALIAAGATVSAALLQLKAALSKDVSSSRQSRRKSRLSAIVFSMLLLVAGIGGYWLSQWLHEDQRAEQAELRQELEARINELGKAAAQLEQTRNGVRMEIENGVLRRFGAEGAVTLATVGPCKPASAAAGTSTVATDAPTACSETEATPVTLCTALPAQATVLAVELFSRPADASGDWSASRQAAGQEVEKARFSDTPVETADGGRAKQICHTFVHWGSDRARSARMLVRYDLAPVLTVQTP
jgi:hypothetical protein